MTELTPFTFPDTGDRVRVVEQDGEPWFVAADVCAILGISNSRDAVGGLDDDEKQHVNATVVNPDGRPGSGPQSYGIVNEAGLYSLILRSRKPEAKTFKRWVTHDVLPSIRRAGGYQVPQPAYRMPQTYGEALRELASTWEQREQLRAELEVAGRKADSWDVLASAEGDHSVADAAKMLSRDPGIGEVGQNRLYGTLGELGWIFRGRGDRRWRAYQEQVDRGRLRERAQAYDHPTGERRLGAPQVRITIKGLHELHRLLGGERPLMLPIGGAA